MDDDDICLESGFDNCFSLSLTHTWPVTRFTPKGVTLFGTRVALPSYDEVRSDEAQLELSECSPVDLSRGKMPTMEAHDAGRQIHGTHRSLTRQRTGPAGGRRESGAEGFPGVAWLAPPTPPPFSSSPVLS